jgi:uncharacterized membrane protein YfcA
VDLTVAEFAIAASIVFVGAMVRGFTGFGASLIWISGLTFLMDPDEAVPVIFCLEVLVSAQLLPACRHEVDWSVLKGLLLGVLVGMPLGTALLLAVNPDPMRIVVSVVVLISAIALGSGMTIPTRGRGATVATGVASGALNGAVATGGPPVIVFFLGSPAGMGAIRASLIAFFGITDIIGIVIVAVTGLLDGTALIRLAVLAPVMFGGAAIGARGFGGATEEAVRRTALVMLSVLAIAGIVTAL